MLGKTEIALCRRLCGLIDRETLAHSCRVAALSAHVGSTLGWDSGTIRAVQCGSLIHDIGKRVIPREILDKPGGLTPQERRIVEVHPVAGVELLAEILPSIAPEALDIVRHHHERLDGSGYPDRLCGSQISQMVRVVSVADVYDALISTRPYRQALSRKEALQILHQEGKAGRLDSQLVEALRQITIQESRLDAATNPAHRC